MSFPNFEMVMIGDMEEEEEGEEVDLKTEMRHMPELCSENCDELPPLQEELDIKEEQIEDDVDEVAETASERWSMSPCPSDQAVGDVSFTEPEVPLDDPLQGDSRGTSKSVFYSIPVPHHSQKPSQQRNKLRIVRLPNVTQQERSLNIQGKKINQLNPRNHPLFKSFLNNLPPVIVHDLQPLTSVEKVLQPKPTPNQSSRFPVTSVEKVLQPQPNFLTSNQSSRPRIMFMKKPLQPSLLKVSSTDIMSKTLLHVPPPKKTTKYTHVPNILRRSTTPSVALKSTQKNVETNNVHLKTSELICTQTNNLNQYSVSPLSYCCIKCNKNFEYALDLKCHSCNNDFKCKFYCKMCPKVFYGSRNLQNHIEKKHSNIVDKKLEVPPDIRLRRIEEWYSGKIYSPKPNFTCAVCKYVTTSKKSLQLHIKSHLKIKYFKCKFCEARFVTNFNLKMHCKKCHNFQTSKNISGKINTKKINPEKQFKCQKCNIKFKTKLTLHIHLKSHSNSYKSKPKLDHGKIRKKKYSCKICNEHFHSKFKMGNHILMTHQKQFLAKFCIQNVNLNSDSESELSVVGNHDVAAESYCSEEDGNADSEKSKIFTCHKCDIIFKTKSEIHQHCKEIHSDVKNTNKFYCSFCNEDFGSIVELKHHRNIHLKKVNTSESRQFHCASCNQEFVALGVLKKHIKSRNCKNDTTEVMKETRSREKRKAFEEKQVKRSKRLKIAGTAIVKETDSEVQKNEVSVNDRLRKRATKEGTDDSRQTEVDDDSKADNIDNNLSDYDEPIDDNVQHGSDSESNDNDSKNEENTQQNLTNRLDERSFACSLCGEQFFVLKKLFLHAEKSHEITVKEIPKSSKLKSTGRFRCKICTNRYCSPKALGIHVLQHRNIKPYFCKFCNETYANRSTLVHHYEKIHDIEGSKRLKIGGTTIMEENDCEVQKNESSMYKKLRKKETSKGADESQQMQAESENENMDENLSNCDEPMDENVQHDSDSENEENTQQNLTNRLDERSFACSLCGEQFFVLKKLFLHAEKSHEITVKEIPKSSKLKSTGRFRCKICTNYYCSPKALGIHVLQHRNIKPYFCKFCNETYANRSTLVHHYEKIHDIEGSKRLKIGGTTIMEENDCEVQKNESSMYKKLRKKETSKGADESQQMQAESENENMDENLSNCDEPMDENVQHDSDSENEENTQQNLTNRLDERSFACSLCSERFFVLKNLFLHAEKSHETTAKEIPKSCKLKSTGRFKCKICTNRYCSPKALGIHVLQHRNIKPYFCKFCKETYANRSTLVHHYEKIHDIEGSKRLKIGGTAIVKETDCEVQKNESSMYKKLRKKEKSKGADESQQTQAESALITLACHKKNHDRKEVENSKRLKIVKETENDSEVQKNESSMYKKSRKRETNEGADESQQTQAESENENVDENLSDHDEPIGDNVQHESDSESNDNDSENEENTQQNLTNRLDERSFACSLCDEQFFVLKNLFLHAEKSHEITVKEIPKSSKLKSTGRFKCKICTNRYCSPKALGIHVLQHRNIKPYFCKFCKETYANRSTLVHHYEKIHDIEGSKRLKIGETAIKKETDCEVQKNESSMYKKLRKKEKSKGADESQQTQAESALITLACHYKENHDGKEVENSKRLKIVKETENDSEVQKNESSMYKKSRKKETNEGADESQQTQAENVDENLSDNDEPIDDNVQHDSESNDNNSKNEESTNANKICYSCSLCGEQFFVLKKLFLHAEKSHEITAKEIPKASKLKSNGRFKCKICTNRYCSPKALGIHVLQHRNIKPYFCKFCKETFAYRSTLVYHYKKIHDEKDVESLKIGGTAIVKESDSEVQKNESSVYERLRKRATHEGTDDSRQTDVDDDSEDENLSDYDEPMDENVQHESDSESNDNDSKNEENTKQNLTNHLKKSSYECSLCHEQFFLLKKLFLHAEKYHEITVKETRITTLKSTGPYKCSFCTKSYYTLRALGIHILEHRNIKPFFCKCCRETFSNRSPLVSHYKKHHNKLYMYYYLKGKEKSETGYQIKNCNINSYSQIYTCNICKIYFSKISHIMKHAKRYHSNNFHDIQSRPSVGSYECDECKQSFLNSATLQYHILKHRKLSALPCLFCKTIVTDLTILYGHYKRSHPREWELHKQRKAESKMLESVKNVNRTFMFEGSKYITLTEFNKNKSLSFECHECKLVLDTKDEVYNHCKIKHSQGKNNKNEKCDPAPLLSIGSGEENINCCKYCEKTFGSERALDAHYRLKHESQRSEEGIKKSEILKAENVIIEFCCQVCDHKFDSHLKLQKHQQTLHDLHTDMTTKCEIPFYCDDCGQEFVTFDVLKKHITSSACKNEFQEISEDGIMTHQKRKMLETPEGRKFKILKILEDNKNDTSPDDKGLKIEDDFLFTTLDSLPIGSVKNNTESAFLGVEASSAEELSFTCDDCNTLFDTKLKIKIHMKRHMKYHNEKTSKKQEITQIICGKCNKTFKLKRYLKLHKCKNQVKTYTCVVCKAIFENKHLYVLHKTTHEKTFVCEICGNGFFTEKVLNIHKINMHEEHKFLCYLCGSKFPSSGKLNIHLKHHEKKVEYSCKVCDKKFLLIKTMQQHYNVVHCDACYFCKTCNQSFNRKDHLEDHERRHAKSYQKKCEFCEKILLSAHGYRSHIKNSHKDS